MLARLFAELRRRNVWRAAALYAAAAWLLVQIATQVFPFFNIPAWVVRWIVVAAVIGFPFWIAFAWFYEITPEGIKREADIDPTESITHRTGKRLDRWIIGILALAVVLLLANTLVRHKESSGTGPAGASPNSIAVLPFANVSSDKEQEYFADGISEDVLDLLTKVTALRVAARTSSFAFKGQELKVQEIARQLNVANVLQGSVRKAGDRVRIDAQLVHAADGYQVWSQTWDRKLDDIFAIQDEIAADVARELKVKLLGGAPTSRQTNPRAYALFLQARELGRRLTLETLAQSDSLYAQVLGIDGRYVPAWTQLGLNFENEGLIGPCCRTEEAQRRARATVEKALAIDSAYAPAYAELGRIKTRGADFSGAAQDLERALTLDPSDLDVLTNSATLLAFLGRLPEATRVLEYVLARDPVNARVMYELARAYYWARRSDDAIASLRTLLSLSPGYGTAHYQIAMALLRKGNPAGALTEVQQETDTGWRLIGLSLVNYALGRIADSNAALNQIITNYAQDASYNIAYIYAYRGEADSAFAWLEKAVKYHDTGVPAIHLNPFFDKIASNPRWVPFLRRINEAPEQLARIHFNVRLPEASAERHADSSGSAVQVAAPAQLHCPATVFRREFFSVFPHAHSALPSASQPAV